MSETFFALLYASRAVEAPTADDLAALLVHSRRSNKRHHITGHLTYIGLGGRQAEVPGYYVQWLEGERDCVETLFRQRIAQDPRHAVERIAYAGSIRQRVFPRWSMRFQRSDFNPAAVTLELARLLGLAEDPSGSPLTSDLPEPDRPAR